MVRMVIKEADTVEEEAEAVCHMTGKKQRGIKDLVTRHNSESHVLHDLLYLAMSPFPKFPLPSTTVNLWGTFSIQS